MKYTEPGVGGQRLWRATTRRSAETNFLDSTMDTAATCIGIFGTLFLFASAIALSIAGGDRDRHDSIGHWLDIWLLSAIVTSTVGFVRGFRAAIADRKSPGFPLLIIFFIGLILVVTSLAMKFKA